MKKIIIKVDLGKGLRSNAGEMNTIIFLQSSGYTIIITMIIYLVVYVSKIYHNSILLTGPQVVFFLDRSENVSLGSLTL